MTAKGLRKCRAGDSEENQKQVSRRSPRALGNRRRDFHIPAAPATTAMGKEKSKNRIPTFPQRLPCPNQTNQKRKEINPSPKPCPSGSSQDWNMLQGRDPRLWQFSHAPAPRAPGPESEDWHAGRSAGKEDPVLQARQRVKGCGEPRGKTG
jgi:hypothetical protein